MSSKPRSKTEINKSYEQLSAGHSKTNLTEKERAQKSEREKQLLQLAANVSPEKALNKIGTASLEVNKTFGQAQELLVNLLDELQKTHAAVELKKAELEELHGKDVIASAKDVLIEEFEAKKKQLETEQAEAKAQWAKERNQLQQDQVEYADRLKQAREREESEFQYTTRQARKIEQDKWTEQQRIAISAERDRRETLEKDWTTREALLKAREQELIDLKAKVDGFPTVMSDAVKREVSIVGNSMKREHEHAMALTQKDAVTQQTILQAQVASHAANEGRLQKQVEDLQLQLSNANMRVTEVAQKALDAASGRQALAEIQSTLQTQSNGPQRKS